MFPRVGEGCRIEGSPDRVGHDVGNLGSSDGQDPGALWGDPASPFRLVEASH
jgi:hypothetical protein